MQFTNSTAKLAPSEALDHKVSHFYRQTFHSLFRRHLLSTLAPKDFANLSEELIEELSNQFQTQGEAQSFLKNFYDLGKEGYNRDLAKSGYSDLVILQDSDFDNDPAITLADLKNLGIPAFTSSLVESQLQPEDDIAGLETDDIILRKLGNFFQSLPFAAAAQKFLCLDLGFDPLITVDLAESGREFASFTLDPEIAALNLLIGLIYEVPVTQHLGTEAELQDSFQTGRLPGCLSTYPINEAHLLHLQRWQKAIPSDFFQIYQQAKSVSLLSPTQFLQRDEFINFRRELLDRKALQTLINFPGSVFQLSTLNLSQPHSLPQGQTLWHFSLHNPSPTFRFLDANQAFQAADWGNNRDPNPALEILTTQLTSPPDQETSFEIPHDKVATPLAMIRLIDFTSQPSDAPAPLKVGDVFELEELQPSPDRPASPNLSDIFDTSSGLFDDFDFDGMEELLGNSEVSTDQQVSKSPSISGDFLVYSDLSHGRLRVAAHNDQRPADSSEYAFILRLKSDSQETDLQILFFVLCGSEFSDALGPFLHGAEKMSIHPSDFLNASLVLPSPKVRSKMKSFILELRLSGRRSSISPSSFYRDWRISQRSGSGLWHIERPEDDWVHSFKALTRNAQQLLRSEIDHEISSQKHQLINIMAGIETNVSLSLKRLNKHRRQIEVMNHPQSGKSPIDYLAEANARIDEINALIVNLTSVTTYKALAKPYQVHSFLTAEKGIFTGLALELPSPEINRPIFTNLNQLEFKDILRNIQSNTMRHGDFENLNRSPRQRIRYGQSSEFFEICFENNGKPFPNGFTTAQYTRNSEAIGPTGNTGRGGFMIGQSMKNIGGDIEVLNTNDADFPVAIVLKFPKNV